MPFLIRLIAQRIVLIIFSSLAFMGLNPDIAVPSPEIVAELQEKQQSRVDQVFTQKDQLMVPPVTQNKAVKEIEEKITEIQKEFTQTITNPLVEKVENVVPVNIINTQNTSPEPSVDFNIQNVVVNIVCMEKTKAYTKISSGSGVIISESGLVITNAHVAYPLLQSSQFGKNTYSCSVRRVNIPNFGYGVEVVYYPSDWLIYNSEIIKDPSPVGTGENDYAILLITSPLGLAPKSASFPSASLNVLLSDLKVGTTLTIAGYPSSNSGVFEVDTNLGLKTAQTQIKDFFTFSSRTFDVLQTDVNPVAKRGSSGGGLFFDNKLYGIIVTTNQNSEGSYVNALTLPYIKKDFENDTRMNLDVFVNTSIDVLKLRFSTMYKQSLLDIISEN